MSPNALLKDPIILSSVAAVIVIAIGSAAYYAIGTQVPQAPQTLTATTTAAITATGTVEPAQNPDLAFQSAGRVAHIAVKVGENVAAGELLASLDTASLSAQRAQADANLKMQQAKLEGLQGGARPEDIAASQAALDKAKQDLANMYAGITDTSADSYAKADDAVRTQVDQLFSNPETGNPRLAYTTANSQAQSDAESERLSIQATLSKWQAQLTNMNQSSAALEGVLQSEISYLADVRQLINSVAKTLDNAPLLTASNLSAYKADISSALTEVNTASKNLNTVSQNIASQKLTVAQSQSQLDLKRAGALPSDISAQEAQVEAAQASIDNFNAQIGNAQVVAPFPGTVASIHVKVGDIVPSNTTAISLNPKSALQITAYVSESDVGQISAGKNADVTLDAYGTDRHFAATVASVDRSPTMQKTVPAYKVTLQFAKNDPAISSGMTANITFAQ